MRLDRFIFAACALSATLAGAQILSTDPEWREIEAPPPPALNLDGLIPLDLPRTELRFGVAPASIAIGSDGVVRYVAVARSSAGAVNAIYEGIRCGTGDFRIYARYSPGSGWVPAKETQWRALHDAPFPRHSLAIARAGACIGHATNRPASQIVHDLLTPTDTRYN